MGFLLHPALSPRERGEHLPRLSVRRAELLDLTRHQLQMNCKALSGLPISWATLAARSVSEWRRSLSMASKSLLPRLSGVVQNQGHAGTSLAFTLDGGGIDS